MSHIYRTSSKCFQLLRASPREVTFRMSTRNDNEIVLDESDYTLDVDGVTRRYASKESGIVVEVKGCSVAIRSSSVFPPTKRSRLANEKVLPTV